MIFIDIHFIDDLFPNFNKLAPSFFNLFMNNVRVAQQPFIFGDPLLLNLPRRQIVNKVEID